MGANTLVKSRMVKNGQGTYTYADGKIRKGFLGERTVKYQIVSPTVTAKKSPAPPLKPKIDHQTSGIGVVQEHCKFLVFIQALDGIIGVRTLAAIRGWQKRRLLCDQELPIQRQGC